MITLRDGVRKAELPALRKAIKGGASPVAVARQFKLQLPVTLVFFKAEKVDIRKFKDEIALKTTDPTALAVQVSSLTDATAKYKERLGEKDAHIAELEAQLNEMTGGAKGKNLFKV